MWICRLPQRIEKFETLQRKAIDEGCQFTEQIYRLVHDNDTRWNSLFAMIERALKLRESIDEYIFKETAKWTEYEMRWQAKNSHRSKPPKKKKRPSILDDQLSADDWHTLTQYHRILKPLKEATMQLQGQVGRHGHIWEVLPIFQQLLEHLERVKDLYTIDNETEVSQAYPEAVELQQEHHFKFNVNLASQKLNEYYERLDETPVYTAALVLHPRYNWAWIQRHWNDRTDWIKNANVVLLKLWQQYSDLPNKFDDPTTRKRSSTPVQRPPKRARRQCYGVGDEEMKFAYSSEEDSPPVSMQDQWQEYTSQRSDKSVHEPYAWWWSTRHRWPQLAMMALDILTVAPMSDEPERQFSDTGMMVTNRRNRLRSDTIAATMSLKSWTREGVISWTRAGMKALTMNTGSNVTNAVTNQSPSNQFARGTNRPI